MPHSEETAATEEDLRRQLNLETGRIGWAELQRHFARGVVVTLDAELDLVEVALRFSRDDRPAIENWLTSGQLRRANDEDARRWQARETVFWAIVVAPWVLVQACA